MRRCRFARWLAAALVCGYIPAGVTMAAGADEPVDLALVLARISSTS
jgi:hypothetical protein